MLSLHGKNFVSNNKTVLVTGGAGFIGKAIVNYLINQGLNVIVIDNCSRPHVKIFKSKNLKFIKGDICDDKTFYKLKKYKKKIRCVVHLAYINGTKNFYKKPLDVLNVAVKGLINTFDYIKKNSIKEVYLASSSEVYYQPKSYPTSESVPLVIPDIFNPRYSYSCGKILSEVYGVNFAKKYLDKLIIFRPHNVYGKNMGHDHVIPEIIKKIKKIKKNKKKEIIIQGNGAEIRSFIYIDDFINAFHIIFNKTKGIDVFNLGNDEPIKIKKLINIISKNYEIKLLIKSGKPAVGATTRRHPDISKIRKLGYTQKIYIEQGIKLLSEDFK
jgi:nucleoside-diphosphate-sugar epimerase